jgi:DNA-binding CsgD family transcriptional regulator/GAF domain-containing protein
VDNSGTDPAADPLAGTLPPWPDHPPASPATTARAVLDDQLADLEERVAGLTAGAGPEFQDAIRALFDLHERRVSAADAILRERGEVLARVHAALAHLRTLPTADAMVAAAPRQACEACGFDRAVLYRIRGKELLAESFWVEGDPEAGERLLKFSREHPAALVSPVLEAEVIRRRMPMAVHQVVNNPRVFAELAGAYDTRSYVAAPIMPEGQVIGFIHADHRLKPRRVDDLDRDSLWAFAEGFGYAVERARLADRLRGQGQELRRLLQRTEAVVADYLDAKVELVSGESDAVGASRMSSAILSGPDNTAFSRLSKRELEVLALVGTGASNADIAARLFITEETAKSHVKRILRKLGAANRVAAATMWLKAQR